MKLMMLFFLFWGTAAGANIITPTIPVDSSTIKFEDDLDFKSLDLAISRQLLAYNKTISLNGKIKFGNKTYPLSILKDSLITFQNITHTALNCFLTKSRSYCLKNFNLVIRNKFQAYAPKTGISKFTGYYSPDFYASMNQTPRFKFPLYHNPGASLATQFTREEIIYDHKLANQKLEAAYIDADLFDVYGLQIEGGGRIHLIDDQGNETLRYLSYDGGNGKTLVFFSKLFKDGGYLNSDQLDYESQHNYFNSHPEIQRTFYAKSPNYIYFKISNEEPEGIDGISLTENRSLAFDKSFYGISGILNFISTTDNSKPMNRFYIGQDVGGAIKGESRADLYFGYGIQARIAAETLIGSGNQYFLIQK